MGQYYLYASQTQHGKLSLYEPDGLKLMESAYFNDPDLSRFLEQACRNPMRIALVGDYCDDIDSPNPETLTTQMVKELHRLAWGDEDMRSTRNRLSGPMPPLHRFIINHTKRLFIDTVRTIEREGFTQADGEAGQVYGFPVNPVAILCALGNGAGGGDYFGLDEDLAGIWAWDLISLDDERPADFAEARPVFIDR